jgi:hypothetical protein
MSCTPDARGKHGHLRVMPISDGASPEVSSGAMVLAHDRVVAIRFVAFVLALAATGCPICPDGELRIVAGVAPVAAGDSIILRLDYGGYHIGSGNCGGHWYVNDVEGGNADVGTIGPCGIYVASSAQLAASGTTSVQIEAMDVPLGERCADCCPAGAVSVALATK